MLFNRRWDLIYIRVVLFGWLLLIGLWCWGSEPVSNWRCGSWFLLNNKAFFNKGDFRFLWSFLVLSLDRFRFDWWLLFNGCLHSLLNCIWYLCLIQIWLYDRREWFIRLIGPLLFWIDYLLLVCYYWFFLRRLLYSRNLCFLLNNLWYLFSWLNILCNELLIRYR